MVDPEENGYRVRYCVRGAGPDVSRKIWKEGCISFKDVEEFGGSAMQQVIFLIGGLALLFLGMDRLSVGFSGLFKPCPGRIDTAGGFLTGLFWTAAVQSSSAVTACLVSMTQAGIFSVVDCFPILLGANVGTTMTVWLFSGLHATALRGIGLIPAVLALVFKKRPTISNTLLGLSMVLLGMELIQAAAEPLQSMAISFVTPRSAFLGSLAFTAVIQSSAAAIGALQEWSALTMELAVPAILGANIGTCVTGLLASALLGREGKRTALLELSINIVGTVLILPILPLIPNLLATPVRIAAAHSLINAVTAGALLPVSAFFRKRTLQTHTERGGKSQKKFEHIIKTV